MAKIPVIIEVKEPSPFGEEVDPDVVSNPQRDYFYIKGYSDKRMARDAAIARGEVPGPLPFRLQAVRAQTAKGQAEGHKIAEWKARGYKVLTWTDAKKLGLDLAESPAIKGEGDAVLIGDQVIMVADAKVAAAHYHANRKQIRDQHEQFVEAPLRNAVERYNQRMGREQLAQGATDAMFEIESGEGPKK